MTLYVDGNDVLKSCSGPRTLTQLVHSKISILLYCTGITNSQWLCVDDIVHVVVENQILELLILIGRIQQVMLFK